MRISRRLSVFILAASALFATQAQAQYRPPVCNDLEAALVSLSRPARSLPTQNRRLETAVRKQAGVIRQTEADAQRAGCNDRGGFFFSGPRPPACRQYDAALAEMRRNLERMQRELGGSGATMSQSETDRQRGRILGELARNGCGPQYARFLPRNRGGGFFGFFNDYSRDPYVSEGEMPDVGAYRTVCVRKCDGFFWPVSFSTIPGHFSSDQAICQASCPGVDVALYAYSNPGGRLEDAETPDGQPYSELENAFRFRNEFVSDCHCPQNELQSVQNEDTPRILATLFPQDSRYAAAGNEKPVPMPERRPSKFEIGLFENPYAPPEPAVAGVTGGEGPVRRSVRVVGPKYVYARSAEEADATRDPKQAR
ncbi:MAG: DUF2865 domain-containing protein [Flavobacteriaceae bacterium]